MSPGLTVWRDIFSLPGRRSVITQLFWLSSNEASMVLSSARMAVSDKTDTDMDCSPGSVDQQFILTPRTPPSTTCMVS